MCLSQESMMLTIRMPLLRTFHSFSAQNTQHLVTITRNSSFTVAPSIFLYFFNDGFVNTEEQHAFGGRLFCEAISVTTFIEVTKEVRQSENAASPRRLFPRFHICYQLNSSRHPSTEIDPLDNGPRYTCPCLLSLWKRLPQFIRTMLRCMLRGFRMKMSPQREV